MGTQYRVTWEMEIEDASPLWAAREARTQMQDENNEMLAFTVTELATGEQHHVDLLEDV